MAARALDATYPHLSDELPTKSSGVFWKVSSFSGPEAGAMRYW